MADHLSQSQLAAYLGRTLHADELLAVDRHLVSCNVCHERLTRMLPLVDDKQSSLELSIEEPFHLDYDQHLVAYVDGTANEIDREIVDSHIALCSECAEDLRDLQEFKHQPVYVPVREERTQQSSSWKKWMVQWQWPRVWNPRFAGALVVAVFILAVTVAVLLWTTRRTQQPVEQAGHTAPTEPNKEPTAAVPQPTADKIAAQPSPERANRDQQPEEPLVALNDAGGQVTLDQRGHLAGLEPLPPDLRRAVESALTTRQLNVPPQLADLSGGAGRLRDGVADQNRFLPQEPVGKVIESDRPTLRWRALEGATTYSVTIHDSRLREVENSEPLSGTEWTISRPLKRGVTYTWQVRAVKDGTTVISPKPPAPEARFKVLGQTAITSLENVKRVHGRSHLAMGVSYWKHGLIDKAEREFEALVRANPNSSVAAQLLRSLRSLRRR